MEFREFLEQEEMKEGKVLSGLKTGLLAGAIGAASALPFFTRTGDNQKHSARPDYVNPDSPRSLEVAEWLKDRGRYYGRPSERKLRKAAEEGDEWAMRELKWPKDHKFHRLGRPYFKNDKPHPLGVFPQY